MSIIAANCKNCGASLNIDIKHGVALCPHCNSRFILNNEGEFEIVAGVLRSYSGEGRMVIVPEGVIEIGYRAFEGTRINKVILPKSTSEISARAFFGCRDLAEVEIKSPKAIVYPEAFAYCDSLNKIILHSDIKNYTTYEKIYRHGDVCLEETAYPFRKYRDTLRVIVSPEETIDFKAFSAIKEEEIEREAERKRMEEEKKSQEELEEKNRKQAEEDRIRKIRAEEERILEEREEARRLAEERFCGTHRIIVLACKVLYFLSFFTLGLTGLIAIPVALYGINAGIYQLDKLSNERRILRALLIASFVNLGIVALLLAIFGFVSCNSNKVTMKAKEEQSVEAITEPSDEESLRYYADDILESMFKEFSEMSPEELGMFGAFVNLLYDENTEPLPPQVTYYY